MTDLIDIYDHLADEYPDKFLVNQGGPLQIIEKIKYGAGYDHKKNREDL